MGFFDFLSQKKRDGAQSDASSAGAYVPSDDSESDAGDASVGDSGGSSDGGGGGGDGGGV